MCRKRLRSPDLSLIGASRNKSPQIGGSEPCQALMQERCRAARCKQQTRSPESPKTGKKKQSQLKYYWFLEFPNSKGPKIEKINLAWSFQSWLKTSISLELFNLDLPYSAKKKNRVLVGGSLEIFNLAWNFQSRSAIFFLSILEPLGNAVVLNAVVRRNAHMNAKERKLGAKEHKHKFAKRAQIRRKGAQKRAKVIANNQVWNDQAWELPVFFFQATKRGLLLAIEPWFSPKHLAHLTYLTFPL